MHYQQTNASTKFAKVCFMFNLVYWLRFEASIGMLKRMYSCGESDDANCSAIKRFGLGSIRCFKLSKFVTV